ncbi:peptidase M23 [beta proteobacterium AAP51]|nr:peptidase M23 [beta proteobacterium AAP51]
MQVLITHGRLARTRVLELQRWQLVLAALLLGGGLLLLSGVVYHSILLKAAREGWPVLSPLVRLIVRDEVQQQERFMRDNLDAIAKKVGDMQAKLLRLEAMGERLQGLAGVPLDELRSARPGAPPASAGQAASAAGPPVPAGAAPTAGGRGGPYLPLAQPSLEQLRQAVTGLEALADFHLDYFTLAESRLLETRLQALLIPSAAPVVGPMGSGFGFRADPFTGRAALHAGLDFPAEVGTPVQAAASGLVSLRESHPEYGQLLEIDHGNGLGTRYAHLSAFEVPVGALVQRGQLVGRVGNTGRSTGPHLHFEVLVNGVPQNPARFLAAGPAPRAAAKARAPGGG